MAFEDEFREVIDFYRSRGGSPVFFNDIRTGDYPSNIHSSILELVKKLHDTIRKQPMRYIGSSIWSDHYALYHEVGSRKLTKDKRGMEVFKWNGQGAL